MDPRPPERLFAYENGYGDFCFIQQNHQSMKRSATSIAKRDAKRDANLPGKVQPCQNQTCEAQLEDPSDETESRFMALPREIRNHIYKNVIRSPYLLPPYYRFGGSVDHFDGVNLHLVAPKLPMIADTEEKRKFVQQYGSRSNFEKHPGRDYHYDLCPDKYGSKNLSHDTEDVLNLSNTNSIVRQELAEVFWARVRIVADDSYITKVDQLLLDRPAIWNGIKELSLSFNIKADDPLPEGFLKSCQILSAMVQLEKLKVILHIDEDILIQTFQTSARPLWLRAFRNFNVSKEFILRCIPRVLYPFECKYGYLKKAVDLSKQYDQKMEDELRPRSLQPKEAKPLSEMNEVERYMATRL